MLDSADLEGCVEALYQLAGLDAGDIRWPTRLAVTLFGAGSVQRVSGAISAAHLARGADGRIWIGVRRGFDRAREQHLVGHELGHWILERQGVHAEQAELEGACDYIGAAVMTRRRPFARAVSGRERDFAQLALDFGASQTLVALRVGEVTGLPVAVVAPHVVRARGVASWPDEGRLRELARRGGPGLARIKLTDDRRRIALVGDDVDEAC